MMNEHDDKIQELAEQSDGGIALSPDEQNELVAYKQLFTMLKQEPDLHIPVDFSVKMVARVRAQVDRKKNVLIYSLTVLLIVNGIFYFTTIITSEMLSNLLDVFYRFRWIGIFTIALFLIIHFASLHLKKNTQEQLI